MAERVLIGIDPGLKGSVAFLKSSGSLAIERIPAHVVQRTLASGKQGAPTNEVNVPALVAVLLKHTTGADVEVWFEDVRSAPHDGRRAAFTFGKVKGQIQGALHAAGLNDAHYVAPSVWKVRMKCTGAKRNARARAEALFPTTRFRSIDDCEAALVAAYGLLVGTP